LSASKTSPKTKLKLAERRWLNMATLMATLAPAFGRPRLVLQQGANSYPHFETISDLGQLGLNPL
jgi:hypothetical protein